MIVKAISNNIVKYDRSIPLIYKNNPTPIVEATEIITGFVNLSNKVRSCNAELTFDSISFLISV